MKSTDTRAWSWYLMQYLISCSFFNHGSQTFKSAHRHAKEILPYRRHGNEHVVQIYCLCTEHACFLKLCSRVSCSCAHSMWTCTHSWCFAFSSGSSDSSCWCVRHSLFMCDLTHFLFCLWTLKQTNTSELQQTHTHSLFSLSFEAVIWDNSDTGSELLYTRY